MMAEDIKIEMRIHDGFAEWKEVKKREARLGQIFGRHDFIYKRGNNIISLIEIKDFFGPDNDRWVWEVHCIKGKLLTSNKRFNYKQEADNYIIRLLTPEDQL